MEFKSIAIYSALFVLSFALFFFLGLGQETIYSHIKDIPLINLFLPTPSFSSPMYYVYFLFGFLSSIIVLSWAEKYFKQDIFSRPLFFLIAILALFAAYYISYIWYYSNISSMQGSPAFPDFWTKLHTSSYYLFLLAFLCGWISELIKRRTMK